MAMTLVQTIEQELNDSLKAKQHATTAVLRLVKNALKNTAIEKRVAFEALTDEQTIAVLRSEVKKRKESIQAYTSGNRPELAKAEQDELLIIERYLPASMPAAEIKKIVAEVVAEQQLTPPYQFGSLMGAVVKKIAGRADGAAVKDAVQQFIASS